MTLNEVRIFDDSGMLVVSPTLIDSWKKQINHKEQCPKCGHTWMSKVRYYRTRTCPKCGEAI